MASIFIKIMSGELPAYKIHEDEWTYSFLALDQVNLGHTLVVPKVEVDHFFEVPEPYFSKVHQNSQKIAQAIRAATGCTRVGEMVVGFEVHHFHLHLVPAWSAAELTFSRAQKRSPEEMKEIQQKIISHLKI